jgi:predicted dehydrogenase
MINLAMLSAAHTHTKGYLNAIAKHDKCRLVALWDDVTDRGERFAEEYSAEFSADLEATVARDDVQGFVVCAENTRHLPLLRAAVPAGKPIFCEKPFTASVADAAEAMALIREHGTVVHMGYFQPFSEEMQGVIGILESGVLGNLTHARYRNAHHAAYGRWFDSPDVAWFTDPELAGGGAFMDMGTHAVHLLRTLLGPVEKVLATIENVSGIYPKVDDTGTALLRFTSGVLAIVEASWVQTGGLSGLEITGSKGTLYHDPRSGYVTALPREDPAPIAVGTAKPRQIDRLVGAIEGTVDPGELEADLTCSADAVAIMEACYRSNGSGAWECVQAM